MIFTDDEMNNLRRSIEAQSGMLPELEIRCGDLIRNGNFEEAIRNAFVLLEESLRTAVNDKQKRTGTNLALYAFDPDTGPLAKHLGRTKQERMGLQGLYAGAFRLLRNPTAHTFIEYDPNEARSILYFINFLLILLDKASELPPPGFFPDYIENGLSTVENEIGVEATIRLRIFLSKCIKLGLRTVKAKQWLPFRSDALQIRQNWDEPRIHRITIFYFVVDGPSKIKLWFPVNQYYSTVIGYDIDRISSQLVDLGFSPTGKQRDYSIDLRHNNDQQFLEEVFQLIKVIDLDMRATM